MEKNINPFLSQVKSLISSSPINLQLIFLGLGIILVVGSFMYKNRPPENNSSIEIISDEGTKSEEVKKEIVVDIRGAVEKPGVYYLKTGSIVEDALIASGGLSQNADITWVDKNIVRAAKVIDGQKIYIPDKQSNVLSANISGGESNVAHSESTAQSNLTNINTSSLSQLEELPGIGQVYGQSIIDHRPYSTLDELVSKKAIRQSTFEKIKDLITLF